MPMRISPLNLISTPLALVNSLGLNLRVGLSSEDPMVCRHPTEAYEAYLSTYSPEGLLMERRHLGQVPPERRRFFPISQITRTLVPQLDHLAVVHRIPTKLASGLSDPAEEIEIGKEPDYSLFRSLVEYSYPGGGNGSVIYETPPGLNAATEGHRSSNTLTFTCQTLVSEKLSTYMALIHHSVNPSYGRIANYHFALHSLSGERVAADNVSIGPFGIKMLDIANLVPSEVIGRERDPQDGLSTFTFVGYSEDAAIQVVVLSLSPALGAVAVEHTHPPQTYLFPWDSSYQKKTKTDAQKGWRSILSAGRSG